MLRNWDEGVILGKGKRKGVETEKLKQRFFRDHGDVKQDVDVFVIKEVRGLELKQV